jgi:ribosomal protein S18 acetylase RimI-like enzyme
MENIHIVSVIIDDIDQLQKIGRQTFFETFSASNSEENMQNYLTEGFSTDKLNSELTDENAEFYFAKINNDVIGYLKLNFGASQTEIKDDKALEIERIYVLKEFHGKKVGQILYDKAIEIAKQKYADFVWLGVWEERLTFIRKMVSLSSTNTFLNLGKTSKLTL